MRTFVRPTPGLNAGQTGPVVRPSAPVWNSAFVVVAAVMFATSVTEIFLGGGGAPGGYPPQVRLSFLLVYAVSGLLLLFSTGEPWALPLRAPLLVGVLAIPPVSILWSVQPGETLERAVAVIGTSLFGAYLGWRFTLGRIIFLMAIAMSIAVALSLMTIVLVPSIGITASGPWAGTWSGVHMHKNGLGNTAALACLLIGYAVADSRGRWRLAFLVALLGAAVLLVGSRSTTALLSVIGVGSIAFWLRYLQRRPTQVPVLTVIIVAGAVIAVVMAGPTLLAGVLESFGKRADLSRFPVWQIVWSFIEQRFWLGYGHEAFWQADTPRTRLFEARLYFVPFYSHNGVLETWLNGGLVLVVLVGALLLTTMVRAMVVLVRWRTLAISSFPLVFSGFFLLTNFTESTVLARNTLVWALMVAVICLLVRWVRPRVL